MAEIIDVKAPVTEHSVVQKPYGGYIAFWRSADNPTWQTICPPGAWNERVPWPCFETRDQALAALGKNHRALIAKIVEVQL